MLALSSAFNAKGYHPPYMVIPEKCSGCDLCGMYCPDFAIFGYKKPAPPKKPPPKQRKPGWAPQLRRRRARPKKEAQDAR